MILAYIGKACDKTISLFGETDAVRLIRTAVILKKMGVCVKFHPRDTYKKVFEPGEKYDKYKNLLIKKIHSIDFDLRDLSNMAEITVDEEASMLYLHFREGEVRKNEKELFFR